MHLGLIHPIEKDCLYSKFRAGINVFFLLRLFKPGDESSGFRCRLSLLPLVLLILGLGTESNDATTFLDLQLAHYESWEFTALTVSQLYPLFIFVLVSYPLCLIQP